MKLLSINEVPQEEWDNVVENSPQAWVFHLHDWIMIESKYGKAESLAFGLASRGQLLAIQPLYCSKLGLGSFEEILIHSGIHRHTGLALLPDVKKDKYKEARAAAMNAIFDYAKSLDADRIHLAHQNLTYESLSHLRTEVPFWVLEYGFQLGASFGPSGILPCPGLTTTVIDQIVDLTVDEQELFEGLDESCRRAIRKGQKAGLVSINLSDDPGCIDEFWRLAQLSAMRTGEQLPDKEYYETIRTKFAPRGIFNVIFVKSENLLVAASILLRYKGACHFLAGVSDPNYLQHRANDFLHWSGLLYAKLSGDRYYRFGPCFPSVPHGWPIEKVSRFKTKFGAKPWTIVQGSLFLKPHRYCELGQTYLINLCSELKGENL